MDIDKQLPMSLDSEKYIISCILNDENIKTRNDKINEINHWDFFSYDFINFIKKIKQRQIQNLGTDFNSLLEIEFNFELLNILQLAITDANWEIKKSYLKKLAAQRYAIIEAQKMLDKLYDPDNSNLANFAEKIKNIANYAISSKSFQNSSKIKSEPTKMGLNSGFLTHDYNDFGFRGGTLTVLTGFRGDGKTTLARQILYFIAQQNKDVFFFAGESNIEEEKYSLVQLSAQHGEVTSFFSSTGKKIYVLNEKTEERFNREIGKKIIICDTSIVENQYMLFDRVLAYAISLAKTGTKFFVFDNVMILNNVSENKKNSEQIRITQLLKKFSQDYDVPVLLLAHPAKGQTSILGASEQENIVDTIIRYKRIAHHEKQEILKFFKFSDELYNNISAILYYEKVRVKGSTTIPMIFTFDNIRGCCIEHSNLEKAEEYQNNLTFTRPIKNK